MNKVFDQDGNLIIATGQANSHIRNKEQYNNTIERLMCRIRTVWARGGLERHCDYSDLEEIMQDDDISKEKWSSLTNSAYYYFDKERGVI